MQNLRKRVLPLLHPVAKRLGRPLIRDKTGSDELIAYTDKSTAEIAEALREQGFTTNPISTLKYVDGPENRIYESLTMAYRESLFAEWQTHVFVFDLGDERAVMSHKEKNLFRYPLKHQQSQYQTAGDPENRTDGISW